MTSTLQWMPYTHTEIRNNATQILASTIVIAVCLRYLQYWWDNRRWFALANQINGPKPVPLLGNALLFLGKQEAVFGNILKIVKEYKTPGRFWLGSKLYVVVYKPRDLEVIFSSQKALQKDPVYNFAKPWLGEGLFTAQMTKWKQHRKIIMPAFNQKILDTFMDVFSEQSNVLVKCLGKELGKKEFDIFGYISRCTLDIICETALGVSVQAQEGDSKYVECASRAMDIMFQRMLKIWYHYDFIFNLTPMAKIERECLDYVHTFANTVIKQHRAQYTSTKGKPDDFTGTKRKAFLQLLMENTDFTDEQIREEVDTITLAGNDTTATVNSFCILLLAMYPDIQDKVWDELHKVFGDSDRNVSLEDLPKLEYLEMVLKETMRLFPVAALQARTSTDDIKLDNCTIPKGTSIAMVLMQTHRDPEYWSNPEVFNPDRFSKEESVGRHPYSYIPFSSGQRNCVGGRYAFMAMKSLIATVLRRYRFTTELRQDELILKQELTMKVAQGFLVKIHRRIKL